MSPTGGLPFQGGTKRNNRINISSSSDLKCCSIIIKFKRIEKEKVIGDKLPNIDV